MKRSLGAKRLVYPLPVLMVGSYGEDGRPDVCNVGWGCVSVSEPPCVQIALRPIRQTLANIRHTGAFTVGIPSACHEVQADYFGCVSAKQEPDKIGKAGMHAVPSECVNAPIIEEFKLTLECKVVCMHEYGSHVQITGEIVNVLADEDVVGEDGIVNIEKLDPIVVDPSADTYHRIGERIGKIFHDGLALK
ncbi:MAG: flavin reductase family protein [Clostridia bacterium]|nr:flavin reductase family protein [Clostridia bacterium]